MNRLFKIVSITLASVILIVLLGKVGLWWLFGGRLWISAKNCPKGHLLTITHAEGKSEPGFQGSGRYYFIAKGNPRPEFCKSFIENYKTLDSPTGRTSNNWRQTSCENFLKIKNWTCYSADRMASNGNTHYYLFAATSPNCSQGIYFSGSGYRPDDFSDKIGFSTK